MKKTRLSQEKQVRLIEFFVVGATARATAEILELNKNTVALYFHKLRLLIYKNSYESVKFSGEIEVDESCFGDIKGDKTENQFLVFGILKRGGKVHVSIVNDRENQTLLPIIKEKVLPNSTILTDCYSSYDILDMSEFKHYRKVFCDKFKHINGMENFWKQAKRHMGRFNGIPKEHFYLFLKECEWRFNTVSLLTMKAQLLRWIE